MQKRVQEIESLFKQFSDRSKVTLKLAHELSLDSGVNLISDHVLFIIVDKSEKYIEKILNNLGADISSLQKQ